MVEIISTHIVILYYIYVCTNVRTCMRRHLHTYLPILPIHLNTYIPTYLYAYTPVYLHIYPHAYYTYSTYIPTCIPTYSFTFAPTYLHACIHTYQHTYIPAHLHVYIPAYLRTHTEARTHTHTTHTHTHTPTHSRTHAFARTYNMRSGVCFLFLICVPTQIHSRAEIRADTSTHTDAQRCVHHTTQGHTLLSSFKSIPRVGIFHPAVQWDPTLPLCVVGSGFPPFPF